MSARELTTEELVRFKSLAKMKTSIESSIDNEEDWNPYDLSGGNFDDAYYLGQKDSDIEYARLILDLYNIEY